jgi:hypothetical protein
MSPDARMVFGLLALAVGLFISERVPLGLAALLIAGLLMAGVIPLGLAMDKTGAAQVLAGQVTATLGTWGPMAENSSHPLRGWLLTPVLWPLHGR